GISCAHRFTPTGRRRSQPLVACSASVGCRRAGGGTPVSAGQPAVSGPQGRLILWLSLLLGTWGPSLVAQAPVSSPVTIGDGVIVSGSIRTRSYSWNWFGDTANGEYTYPGSLVRFGLPARKERFDWQAELAVPVILNLATTSVMLPPQGELGLGATYFAANSRANTAALFLKQGFVNVKGIAGLEGQSLKIGRTDFNDGTEVTPKSATLAALKRDRISQRL